MPETVLPSTGKINTKELSFDEFKKFIAEADADMCSRGATPAAVIVRQAGAR